MKSTLLGEFGKRSKQPTPISYPAHTNILQVAVGQITENGIINPLVQKVLEKIFTLLGSQDRFQL